MKCSIHSFLAWGIVWQSNKGCPDFTNVEQETCNPERCEDSVVCPDSLFDVAFLVEANAAADGAKVKDFLAKLIR